MGPVVPALGGNLGGRGGFPPAVGELPAPEVPSAVALLGGSLGVAAADEQLVSVRDNIGGWLESSSSLSIPRPLYC